MVRVAAVRCIFKEAPGIVHQRVVITDDARIHRDQVEVAKYNLNSISASYRMQIRNLSVWEKEPTVTVWKQEAPLEKKLEADQIRVLLINLNVPPSFGSFIFTYVFHIDL